MASIKQIMGEQGDKREAKELRKLLENALTDLTALRNAHVALAAKLDADGTVTDTNYGALTNPAALTLTA